MIKKLSLILFALLFIYSHNAQSIDFNELDQKLTAAVEDFKVPGFALGIIKNGKVIFQKGYGLKSKSADDEVTPETLFEIASVSKAFTAASIGMLVDEGKLDWDDKVVKYIPWFRLDDPYLTDDLRIADLLCHRAGYRTFDGDLLWYGTDYSSEEVLERFAEMPAKYPIRSRYGYSNIMFIAAGEVIEAVSGMSWQQFIETRIFEPLGMAASLTGNHEVTANTNKALPHINGEVIEYLDYTNVAAAASINSNVTDLLKWLDFWINRGKVGETQLLSERSFNKILSAHTAQNVRNPYEIGGTHFSAAALGWFVNDYAGRKIAEHGGGLPGYISKVIFVPEDSIGIVALTNDMSILPATAASAILDLMLGKSGYDKFEEGLQTVERYESYREKREKERIDSRVEGTSFSKSLEDYAGVYKDKMYGDTEIVLEDGELNFKMMPSTKLFNSKMEHWHYDTFKIKFKDPFLPFGLVTFHFNSSGEIESFTIDLPNPDFHFFNLKFEKTGQAE